NRIGPFMLALPQVFSRAEAIKSLATPEQEAGDWLHGLSLSQRFRLGTMPPRLQTETVSGRDGGITGADVPNCSFFTIDQATLREYIQIKDSERGDAGR